MKFAAVGLLAVNFWLSLWCCCHVPLPLSAEVQNETGMNCHAEPQPAPPSHGCCSTQSGENAAAEDAAPEVIVQAPCGCDDHGDAFTPALTLTGNADLNADFVPAPNALYDSVVFLRFPAALTQYHDRDGPLAPFVLQPKLTVLSRFLI